MTMEIQIDDRILPLDLAIRYYARWDCDVASKTHNSIYYKFLHGSGAVEYLNGNTYSGTFENGLMSGHGAYQWKTGLKYEGEFQKNNVTGRGKLYWPDGSYYSGEVLAGKRDGFGEYSCAVDRSSYKGFWKDGLKQGKGTLTFSNGAVYEGEFDKGLRQGAGKIKYASGNQYEGEWFLDKKQGRGVMNWYSCFQRYEGDWSNDLPAGSGTYFWFEGKNEIKNLKTIYKGSWKAGKREGYGCFYYNNGCKLEGSFQNNLKEGLSILTDQFGQCHIEYFSRDKSTLKKEITQRQSKKAFKLPELNPKVDAMNPKVDAINPKVDAMNAKVDAILQNNEPTQNIYSKFLDIKCALIDESILHLLLRQNSQLRNDYKALSMNSGKQMFSGVTMESVWKLVKDMKVSNQFISLARINREFYKGSKSQFQISMPNIAKLRLFEQCPHLLKKYAEKDIEWRVFFDKVKQTTKDINNTQNKIKPSDVEKVSFNSPIDLHHSQHTVLFRHFVLYLLHIAILQYHHTNNSSHTTATTFRRCFQELLVSVKTAFNITPIVSLKTQKLCSEVMTNLSHNQQRFTIPEEYSNINKKFFQMLTQQKPNLLSVIDATVTVKQLYSLLIRCGILKEPAEKMLFLQKIERNMDIKGSILKKQFKQYYNSLEKVAFSSPHFAHLMNYEMIVSELDEILYILLNRKIGNAQNKEEFLKKYRETVRSMCHECAKHREEQRQGRTALPFRFGRQSWKDKQRKQLLRRMEEDRHRKIEEERKINELKREERERQLMKREDTDIKDYEESEQSEQYYD